MSDSKPAYKLYNRLGSGGFAVEAALSIAGKPFELISLNSTPGTELPVSFREINPWGQVPVLITPEGKLMTESAAMLAFLATQDSSGVLGPTVEQAEFAELMRWLVFLSANVYEAILRKGYPHRFTSDTAATEGVITAARQQAQRGFELADKQLQDCDYLIANSFSVADIYLAMLYAWHYDTNACPRCRALTHRVAADPRIAAIWQRNFDHRLAVKWGRE